MKGDGTSPVVRCAWTRWIVPSTRVTPPDIRALAPLVVWAFALHHSIRRRPVPVVVPIWRALSGAPPPPPPPRQRSSDARFNVVRPKARNGSARISLQLAQLFLPTTALQQTGLHERDPRPGPTESPGSLRRPTPHSYPTLPIVPRSNTADVACSPTGPSTSATRRFHSHSCGSWFDSLTECGAGVRGVLWCGECGVRISSGL